MSNKIRLDKILSVDFELTCWEGPPPPGQRPEIIQIGLCEIDCLTWERTRTGMWYVKNEQSGVSEFCTELTGITQRVLDRRGVPLSEAARLLKKKFGTLGKTWMAWGHDLDDHDADCASKGVEKFMSTSFLNLGLLYSQVAGEGRSLGLGETCERLGVEFGGKAHDALDDAVALADVARVLLPRFGMTPYASELASHATWSSLR